MKFAFYKGRHSLLDRVVSWWTRGPYSHVEAILEESDGVCTLASSVPGVGVRIEEGQVLLAADWDIVDGPGDAVAARAWFEAHTGQPYDYAGLLGFIVRPVIGASKRTFFCSEACLAAIGFPDPWRYDPNGMQDIVAFMA